ncbi:Lipin/Ned1/Smp2-domain-containing protein [Dipodascopsis tothii]|uniref:Lipin/Ned1/Smp2-domain-containing protein n=1 Tax=Dipodascopsis tothii TaxID=44089 RepID=UPI0034CD6CA8
MQYVGRAIGSVSKTWNSLNPATLSGAIDVIVIEQENGDLACSPFHVRFGKFSLLQPSQKKVEFAVNGRKSGFAMKLGDGGEAFFVFETDTDVPQDLLTSPVLSPSPSAASSPAPNEAGGGLQEPDYLDLSSSPVRTATNMSTASAPLEPVRSQSLPPTADSASDSNVPAPAATRWGSVSAARRGSQPAAPLATPPDSVLSASPEAEWPSRELRQALAASMRSDDPESSSAVSGSPPSPRSRSPPLNRDQALLRAQALSRKLSISQIPTKVTEAGDVMLDMRGYKAGEEETARAEALAKRILAEEFDLSAEISSMLTPDDKGNLWIYASEDARERARHGSMEFDYEPDDLKDGPSTPPITPPLASVGRGDLDGEGQKYAKTLRLTSDQLKSLELNPGCNPMTFSVNQGRAVCAARIFYWRYDAPVVISDIDGTITKSDALGHVLTMLGRDWTHAGVAKLFTDISNNGYNLVYLTSRSVGQADSTRHYLRGIEQGTYKVPAGPVILSPDRTIAALRREVIYRKPEVFKMACLRDIQSLYGLREGTPFYAGFGNRITDALSYRSVGVPSSRIFTINPNADVHMELLELAGYKSSYVHMSDLVDHFFPPVSVQLGDERYTDVNFWREPMLDISDSSDDDSTARGSAPSTHSTASKAASYNDDDEGDDDDDDDDYDDDEPYFADDGLITPVPAPDDGTPSSVFTDDYGSEVSSLTGLS